MNLEEEIQNSASLYDHDVSQSQKSGQELKKIALLMDLNGDKSSEENALFYND